jgi:hypothetical protein
MKYLFILIVCVGLSMIILSSCENDLNQLPLSTSTAEAFYSTKNDFIHARNALYNEALENYPNRLMNLSETRSDNIYAVTGASQGYPWTGINDYYSTISTNSYISSAWDTDYNAIYKANQLIQKLGKIKGKNILNVQDRKTMMAEARFLRAFCYFDLVRWFGKVPIVMKTVTVNMAKKIIRSPVKDVYNKVIIPDLKFAVANLPKSYNSNNTGRVTKYAAEGILAIVYMTESSPTYGINGPGLGLNKWKQAYQLLDNIKESGRFEMVHPYSKVFQDENNKEVIFQVPYKANTNEGVGGDFMAVTLAPDGYFKYLGISAQGAQVGRPMSTVLRAKFKNTERLHYSVVDTFTYGKVFHNQPFCIKYIDLSRYSGRRDWGVNFIILRYTNVLMLMAECTLHGEGGTQADVNRIVAKVRRRAGEKNVHVSGITLDSLFTEKQKEFFGEGIRWFSLYRSGEIVKKINSWEKVQDKAHKLNKFTKDDIIYPIPQSEIDKSQGLYKQNPGY